CVRGRSTIAKCPRRKLGWLVFTAGGLVLLGGAVPLVFRDSPPPKQGFPGFGEVKAPVVQPPATLAAEFFPIADRTESRGRGGGGPKAGLRPRGTFRAEEPLRQRRPRRQAHHRDVLYSQRPRRSLYRSERRPAARNRNGRLQGIPSSERHGRWKAEIDGR